MLKFEWFSEKERINAEKHGIKLDAVKKVFDDPFRIEQYDAAHSGLEDRWQTLGMAGEILLVVYTERGKTVRVIMAREATPEERQIYYGTKNTGSWFIP